MIRYHFDLYPRDDPRDGALLVRFTKLQSAEYRGEANGTGAGRFSIRGDTTDAGFIDPAGLQYVRVVREDTVAVTEAVVGGFFLDNGDFTALDDNGTRLLVFGGAGTLSYLARAVMAPHTYISPIFTGQDPFDDIWRLYAQSTVYANGNYLGAMLWRVIYEAQHFTPGSHKHKDGVIVADTHADDRDESAIPDLVIGFDQFVDSSAATWTASSGEFKAQIGENVLHIVKRLMEAGLYVSMDPDTFELDAWQAAGHGRTRTGGAWGASVIRFQAPSAGTVDTGNIKSDAKRGIAAFVKRSLLWAGGSDVYAKSTTGGSDIPWEGFYPSDTSDAAALGAIATVQLGARSDAGDTLRLRMKLDASPTTGKYLPFETAGVLLDDTVTVHTGTGQWDWNEDTFPVAALTVALRKGGDWDAWADLGSTYTSMAERPFQVASLGRLPLELCRPGFVVAFAPIATLGAAGSTSGANELSQVVPGPRAEVVDLTLTRGAAIGQSIVCIVGHTHNANPANAIWDDAGNTYTLAAEHRKTISGDQPRVLIYYSNLTASLSIGQKIRWEVDVGSSISGTDETDARVISAWLFDGTLSAPVESGATSGFTSAPSVAVAGSTGLLVAGLITKAGDTDTITDDGDWTSFTRTIGTFALSYSQLAGGFRVNDAGGETWSGTISSVRDWAMVGAYFTTSGAGLPGDGRSELIGSSVRAKRCDDTEHYHTTADPTVDDDAAVGFRNGTLWINESTGAMFLLLDNAEGAADWLAVGGAGADLSGIDFLVGTASGDLSAEIVVGTTPGGELSGTWAAPTVDATHSGSTHSASTDTHIADALDAHDASAVSVLDTGAYFTGTDVEAVLQELGAAGDIADALSAKASGSGDVTTTASLADVTGATLSLEAGTYVVVGVFDTLVNNASNDRTFEGHLDVGGVDENDYANLVAPGLVNVRATVAQSWRLVLASTTTVKLRTLHSGGTVGDFTVKSTNTTITAYRAGGGAVGSYTIGDWSGATQVAPTGTVVWTAGTDQIAGRGVLSAKFNAVAVSDAAVILKAIGGSSPRRIQTAFRMMGRHVNYMMAGPCFTDGVVAGSKIIWGMSSYSTAVAAGAAYIYRGGTITAFDAAFTEYAASLAYGNVSVLHMRLTWVAADTWRLELSPDAVSWTTFGVADPSSTMTPTHVGFGVTNYSASTVDRIVTFEYFIDEAG